MYSYIYVDRCVTDSYCHMLLLFPSVLGPVKGYIDCLCTLCAAVRQIYIVCHIYVIKAAGTLSLKMLPA